MLRIVIIPVLVALLILTPGVCSCMAAAPCCTSCQHQDLDDDHPGECQHGDQDDDHEQAPGDSSCPDADCPDCPNGPAAPKCPCPGGCALCSVAKALCAAAPCLVRDVPYV